MKPADWTRVRPLLEELLELESPSRDARLLQVLGNEPELLEEVRALVADEPNDDFLVPPRAGTAQVATIEVQSGWYVGRRLGAWRIDELIAVGGMGAVFSAAREEADFEQRAAVKVLATGLDDEESVRRFHRERQVLAKLEHPSITRLLDGGTTEDGRPFLVMEWVDGRPIHHDAADGKLPVEEAIRRVLEVCDAVAHAHRNLIVHRDLKPANLLITAEGRVKLLDFGISSLLHEPAGDAAATTLSSAMTLRYSSPEQLRGRAITTSTDVYSLGVVLYELLTGHTPVDDELDLARAIERVCAGDYVAISKRREGLDPELDAILATAMAEDPARRYASIEAFAADLRRHLAGEIVQAHPPTAMYRLAKLARRHRGMVVSGAAIVLLLAVLSTVLFVANRGLQRERATALAARGVAEDVNAVLLAMLEGADPVRLGGGELTVLDLLAEAASNLDRQPYAPAAEATLRLTIGRAYLDLSLAAEAAPQLERAIELLRDLPDERRALTRALEAQAEVAAWRLDLEGACAAMRECAELLDAERDGHAPLARVTSRLAELSVVGEAEEELEARMVVALEHARRAIDDDPAAAAQAMERIASLRMAQGRAEEALALSDEALFLRRAQFGTEPVQLAAGLRARAGLLLTLGEFEACEGLLRETVALLEEPGGGPQLGSIDARIALGFCAMSAGRMDEALERFEQAAELAERTLPEWHAKAAFARGRYGDLLTTMGRYAEAEPLLISAWRAQNRLAGAGNAISVQLRQRIAGLYAEWGRPEEAARWRQGEVK